LIEHGEVLKISATDVLMELGQFARNSGLAFPEQGCHILERFFQPLRGFEKNQGQAQRPDLIQSGAARVARRWQKTDEEKPVRRQSGEDEPSEHRRGARNGMNLGTRGNRLSHKFVTGIGNERCSRVADERQAITVFESLEKLRSDPGSIVIVVGKQRTRNAVNGEKLGGVARILRQNRLAASQHDEGSQADVLRIANRRCSNIEALFQRPLPFRTCWRRFSHWHPMCERRRLIMHMFRAKCSAALHALRRACRLAPLFALPIAGGCMMAAPPAPKPVASVARTIPAGTLATRPLTADQSGFLRLGNIPPGRTPVRIGILLPFSNGSSATRTLAASLMKSAALALFNSQNHDLLLISADEGSGDAEAIAGVRVLLNEGAEVIVGPLFSQSVTAIAPITRDHAVPVISFSTDRAVAGDGVYLLSFQPENEVRRIVRYAAEQGHSAFAGLVPNTAYGSHVAQAFEETVKSAGGRVVGVEHFVPANASIAAPVLKVAQLGPDAVLIAQGGALLRDIASSLATDGAGSRQVQFLGTGLWDDAATTHEPALLGGWFAAPDPDAIQGFEARFRAVFGTSPPALASLAYDAVSLVAALASGTPYHRFTREALTDPNGFSGVDGVFRFGVDGTSERCLAVLKIEEGGNIAVISPAPRNFLPAS
jgi:branched-chain amino acid transport system substrate-binding protein